MNLRPIGEEYWYEFGESFSNDCAKHRVLYRVTGYSKTMRFHGDTEGTTVTDAMPIASQRAELQGYNLQGEKIYGEWRENECHNIQYK